LKIISVIRNQKVRLKKKVSEGQYQTQLLL